MEGIRDYLGAAHDPDTIEVMTAAYDRTLRELHDRGQPKIVLEVIAKRIIELTAIGERDPIRLSDTVLAELGLMRA